MEDWNIVTDSSPSSLSISQEVLRSVLYGKWCNVFGGQKELTFKSNFLDKTEYPSDEGKNFLGYKILLNAARSLLTILFFPAGLFLTEYVKTTSFELHDFCQEGEII
jgi:hypothetical protein